MFFEFNLGKGEITKDAIDKAMTWGSSLGGKGTTTVGGKKYAWIGTVYNQSSTSALDEIRNLGYYVRVSQNKAYGTFIIYARKKR